MVNNAYIGMPNFHMSHLSKTKANINKGAINVAKANITTVFKDKLGICFLYIAHAIPIRKIGAYKRTFCSITPTAKCPPNNVNIINIHGTFFIPQYRSG